MRSLTILIIILTYTVIGNAQPVLTYSAFAPNNGDSYIVGHCGGNATGTTGINQTWNFSTYTIANTDTYTVVPTSSAAVSSYYPGATQALFLGGYTMLNVTPSDYRYYGSTLTPGMPGFSYSDPEKIFVFPMNYGDSYSDTYEGPNLSGPEYRVANVVVTYIGYGTIITPYNTYANTICIRRQRTEADTTSSGGFNYCDEDGYYWYASGYRYPVAYSWNYGGFNCGGHSTGTLFLQSITIGQDEFLQTDFSMDVFPNPFSSSFTLKTANGKQGDVFKISDLSGRIVKTFGWSAQEMQVDLSALENGTYIVRLNNGHGKQIVKVSN